MRAAVILFIAAAPLCAADAAVYAGDWGDAHARCRPVPLANVKATGFLGRHVDANRGSLLTGLKSPIPRRFEARVAGLEPGPETNRLASDSDLYKWMEGAAYTVKATGDRELEAQLERIAGLVVACQQPDGYINTQVPPNQRFDPRVNHDLYTAGHFFEAAVAHYRATGRRTLLDPARRWADYLIAENKRGNPYFETVARREHSEYELGLLRLYRATGDQRYLDFSITLTKLIPLGPALITGRHAVRTNYLLAGYADLALETGRDEFRGGLDPLWDEIVNTRSFVTGGVSVHEAYQKEPYWLPQSTTHERRDIAETCTSISLMMFAWRMHALTGDSRYFDRIETILYNHFLGAVSPDHLATFYYNPLRMTGDLRKKTDHDGPLTVRTRLPAIHSTACCITNEWRFFGALGEYLFSYDRDGIYVNLYTAGQLRQPLPSGAEVALAIETAYPHQADVRIRVEKPGRYALRLRVPAWAQRATVAIGKDAPRAVTAGRYAVLDRAWKAGDEIRLRLPMPVRVIVPDPRDKENEGQVAFARGPLVYCLEKQDSAIPLEEVRVRPTAAGVRVRWRPDLLGGLNVLSMKNMKLIPFYARANRSQDNRWLTYLPAR